MYRFIALTWNAPRSPSPRALGKLRAAIGARLNGWSIAYDAPGVLVAHTGYRSTSADARALAGGAGAVIGNVFSRRHSNYASRPQVSFDQDESGRIVASGGQHLIDQYWGAYVAIVRDVSSGKCHVIRDPSAGLPCYHAPHDGVEVFFSHVEECVRLMAMSFAPNPHYLARWLVFNSLQLRESGLRNVDELMGGERLTFSEGGVTRSLLWDPVAIAAEPRFEDPGAAAAELRHVVQGTVDAWASCYRKIAHQLSGGLDSSIVAGCLAQSPSTPQVQYLNFSADISFEQEPLHIPGLDPHLAAKLKAISGTGDERYFARLIAEKWKVPLIERHRDRSMDLSRLWRAPLMTSPPMLYTAMELDDAKVELARDQGVEAFFSGLAGDSVFLATIQPLPAMDYAYVHGIDSRLWHHVMATAALSNESIWSVLAKTVRHGLLAVPYRSPVKLLATATMLSEEWTRDIVEDDFAGFWAKPAARLPPGKQLHLAGIAAAAYHDYIFDSGRYADHVEPLHSQPVSELTLRIPTYTALANGVSRGLARGAFADLLPDEIRRRQVKGSGNPFYQHMVRQNLDLLREHLLGGLLVTKGYVDGRALANYLSTDEPVFQSMQATRLLNFLSAEIWLRRLDDVRHRIAA